MQEVEKSNDLLSRLYFSSIVIKLKLDIEDLK